MSNSKIIADFNSCLEKATNPMQVNPDYSSIGKICQLIDDGLVEPQAAIEAIHGKIMDENPDIVFFALKVLEIIFYHCGNLVHKVVCTTNYMNLLKDIIQNTEYKKIRDKILELIQEWTERLKYFPNYSAPRELLQSLQEEGYVFPGLEKLIDNNQKIVINENILLQDKDKFSNDNTSCNISSYKSENKDLKANSHENVDDKGDFQQCFREAQERRKKNHKEYLKSQGLPTSSDEEDLIVIDEEKPSCALNSNACQNQKKQNDSKNHALPKELDKFKKQRQKLNIDTEEIRKLKHQNFIQNYNDDNCELRQCQDPNCEHCNKYKFVEEKDIVIPKRMPYEIRKVIESKEKQRCDIEEIKRLKKQMYYDKIQGLRSSEENNNKDKKLSINSKDEQSVQLSEIDNNIHYDKENLNEYERLELQQALELSRLETGNIETLHFSEDESEDELQQAINLSFTEAEEKNFSSMPKFDEDALLNFAKQLSLEETNNLQTIVEPDEDKSEWEYCIVCYELRSLRSFKPCNHKCICDICCRSYNTPMCPICRNDYSSISID